MKGKTGKPSKMRGGGMARKGVGMALKGGGAVVKPKPKYDVKGLDDKVSARYAADIDKAVPTGIFQRAMFRRESGNPDDMKLRKSMVDKAVSSRKRDADLITTYGKDAMKARSFMAKKNGGKVKGKK